MTDAPPLRTVIAWNLHKPVPNGALLVCGHWVPHHDWEGDAWRYNQVIQKTLAKERKAALPKRKRCRRCGQNERQLSLFA